MANIDINDELKPIPEIGKYYHFWDDGKVSPGRHYICKCERILTIKEAKNFYVDIPHPYIDDETLQIPLYNHWYDDEMPNHDWLYDTETDYFVECSCPEYDENTLWFIRTKDGGWFSMDIQGWWQSGRLDVDSEIYNEVIEDCYENTYIDPNEYVPADEKHYLKRF